MKTVVDMRYLGVPARFWRDTVKYDAWGTPYATDGDRFVPFVRVLEPDGSTDDSRTQWKLHSGPEVTFPDAEASARGWRPGER